MPQMSEMAKCGQTNAGKNARMSKARNERMTLEQQIQPLVTKDIPTFFPALVCPHFAISDICDICPLQRRIVGA
jgi:CO dehydrogenase/acetyl-CoA synthase beta subunit